MTIETRITDRLRPAIINHNNYILHQYRGLQYGRVPRRFSEPEAVAIDNLLLQPDCTQFGYINFLFIHSAISATERETRRPICPQVSVDFHHLLRVPESLKGAEQRPRFDEFACLNLDITVPETAEEKLPVYIWIHGQPLCPNRRP